MEHFAQDHTERAQQSQEEKQGPCEQCGVSIRPQHLTIFGDSNNNTQIPSSFKRDGYFQAKADFEVK